MVPANPFEVNSAPLPTYSKNYNEIDINNIKNV